LKAGAASGRAKAEAPYFWAGARGVACAHARAGVEKREEREEKKRKEKINERR